MTYRIFAGHIPKAPAEVTAGQEAKVTIGPLELNWDAALEAGGFFVGKAGKNAD